MSPFFTKIKKTIIDSISKPSSNQNLKSQRYSAFAEYASDTIANFTPSAIIPAKFSQTALSMQSIFCKDTHFHEKLFHALQALTCICQLILSGYLFLIDNESCRQTTNLLCRAMMLSHILFRSINATGWIMAEYNAPTQENLHAKPA